jgi:hypothetical protein
MAKTIDKYLYYIQHYDYIKLKELPRLRLEDIKNKIHNIYHKIILFAFYNYYSELDIIFSFNKLNNSNIIYDIIIMNKLKTFNYFISRGINSHMNLYNYTIAVDWCCDKILPYYESKGFNLNDYNHFKNISLFNIYRLKTYKYLFNNGFNINTKLMYGNNLFTKEIYSYNSNLKELKYLKSKGINIYYNIRESLLRYSYHKYKNPNLLFLRKLYSPNYFSGKILYI